MRVRLRELSREPRALHAFGYVAGQRFGVVVLGEPKLSLPVESLQGFLDAYTVGQGDASVDYIHGEEAVRTLERGCQRKDSPPTPRAPRSWGSFRETRLT